METVDTSRNTTKTFNNVKISISNTAESTCFNWKQSFNGAEYAGMTVNFRNGQFYSLSDIRNLYTVGSTSVNISKEEAIVLAHKYTENLLWTVGSEEVTNFNIVEEATEPELLTRSREDTLTLYPYWYVLVYLGELYPGNVRHIQVMFWADTGELIDCQPLSFGGGFSHEPVNTEELVPTVQTSSAIQQNEDSSFSTGTPVIALAITTIFTITIIALVYKKKCK